MDKFVTYVLYSDKHKRLYIGHSDNLDRRILQHNGGKVISTKPFVPYRLIYSEQFDNRSDAIIREKELKKTKGRRFLKGFI
ncbi:MAG: GIY-YIG nuclease family protein [Ignavibacteriae bacterium]|nr:GIY-YIG nuclease family protein [Ignavibacteriota bacterium]